MLSNDVFLLLQELGELIWKIHQQTRAVSACNCPPGVQDMLLFNRNLQKLSEFN